MGDVPCVPEGPSGNYMFWDDGQGVRLIQMDSHAEDVTFDPTALKPELEAQYIPDKIIEYGQEIEPVPGDWVSYPGKDGSRVIRRLEQPEEEIIDSKTETTNEWVPVTTPDHSPVQLNASPGVTPMLEQLPPMECPAIYKVDENGTQTIGPSDKDFKIAKAKAVEKKAREIRQKSGKSSFFQRVKDKVMSFIESPGMMRFASICENIIVPIGNAVVVAIALMRFI